ncbi:hypothetical protein RL72_01588 [Microbacterium azadirachtae]|uniref:Uncharacterized protein n=1 Tax=Microbacterium azadirachtae TaxID=582680 RepID=A0A0F0KXP9_9MICO|nr:hypothetical protein [Microbacterium azadirachtae]KJL24865.1 hypothetical protein RL72_01588 [Microbacterium azadirachtae]
MSAPLPEDWIAATGLWPVHDDVANVVVPDHVLADPNLSLIAKGLFTLLVAEQGQPVNPFDDPYEDVADIQAAVDELVEAGLALRVVKP